jgi:hypothetical protein
VENGYWNFYWNFYWDCVNECAFNADHGAEVENMKLYWKGSTPFKKQDRLGVPLYDYNDQIDWVRKELLLSQPSPKPLVVTYSLDLISKVNLNGENLS